MNLNILIVIYSLTASIRLLAIGFCGASKIDASNSSRNYFNEV